MLRRAQGGYANRWEKREKEVWDMETRYLKTLAMVQKTGSISRAAEALHITQSAASQRIKFLEETYGHQLLDRSGPTLELTSAGRLVLDKAQAILAKEQELLEELRRFEGHKRLSLCCTPTFGTAYLPGILNGFMLRHTDVTDLKFIFSTPQQALKGLREGEYNLAAIEHCESCEDPALQTIALPRDELVFISAPQLGVGGPFVELDALLKHRLYARKDGCSSKMLLRSNLALLSRKVGDFRHVVISDDLRLTIESVLAAGGISFISRSLVAAHLQSGRLCAHHVNGFNHFRCRSVIIPSAKNDDPVLMSFLGSVLGAFEGEPEAGRSGDGQPLRQLSAVAG